MNRYLIGLGSLPSLRSVHSIDYKEFRVNIDPRWIPRKMLEKTRYPAGGTRRMAFECIDAGLDLPEFRGTPQVLRPHELARHLERRDTALVCPRCPGCCARIQEGRAQCLHDWPMLDRPVP